MIYLDLTPDRDRKAILVQAILYIQTSSAGPDPRQVYGYQRKHEQYQRRGFWNCSRITDHGGQQSNEGRNVQIFELAAHIHVRCGIACFRKRQEQSGLIFGCQSRHKRGNVEVVDRSVMIDVPF